MAEINDGFWQFAELLSPKEAATGGRTPAKVSRVDGDGTVWVTLPGATGETPINGTSTADVSQGDTVSVTIANGRADLDGNSSSPAVGQREVDYTVAPVANMAERAAEEAASVYGIAEQAQTAAAEALEVAEATGQHFWYDDGGAHVSTTADNPTGTSNSLWNAAGLLIRKAANLLVSITQSAIAFYDGTGNNASNVVASFGSSGARVGYSSDAHVSIDGDSLDINDGSTLLATFNADGARIGANSRQAEIDFCNGLGTVSSYEGNMSLESENGVRLWSGKEDADLGKTAEGVVNTYIIMHGEEPIEEGSSIVLPAIASSTTVLNSQAADLSGTNSYVADVTAVAECYDGTWNSEVNLDAEGSSLHLGNSSGTKVARMKASNIYFDTASAYFQLTGAGNIRLNDSSGNATAYFVRYDASNDNRVQLEHRGACIWQNSSRNLHLANGTTDSNSTWEYSFEAGGLYRRTKSGSTWSSWTKLA